MSFSDLVLNVIIFRMIIIIKEEIIMLDIKILLVIYIKY